MARILMSLMLVAGLAVAGNAAILQYEIAGVQTDSTVLLAGNTVDVSLVVITEGTETWNTADVWVFESNTSGVDVTAVTGIPGTWATFGSYDFVTEAVSGMNMMGVNSGTITLATLTVAAGTADAAAVMGAAGMSTIGSVGLPLALTVKPLALTPEPATLALLVMGGLAAIRRRR